MRGNKVVVLGMGEEDPTPNKFLVTVLIRALAPQRIAPGWGIYHPGGGITLPPGRFGYYNIPREIF